MSLSHEMSRAHVAAWNPCDSLDDARKVLDAPGPFLGVLQHHFQGAQVLNVEPGPRDNIAPHRAPGESAQKSEKGRTSNMKSCTPFLTSWLLPWPVNTPLPPNAISMLRARNSEPERSAVSRNTHSVRAPERKERRGGRPGGPEDVSVCRERRLLFTRDEVPNLTERGASAAQSQLPHAGQLRVRAAESRLYPRVFRTDLDVTIL